MHSAITEKPLQTVHNMALAVSKYNIGRNPLKNTKHSVFKNINMSTKNINMSRMVEIYGGAFNSATASRR